MVDAADLGFTLEDIHQQMATCQLCLDTGNYVFPRAIFTGDASARIMTIGQAPGITEKDAGRPFNAGSGKRLFQWLGEAGIDEMRGRLVAERDHDRYGRMLPDHGRSPLLDRESIVGCR